MQLFSIGGGQTSFRITEGLVESDSTQLTVHESMGIGINFAGSPISRAYSEDIALSTSHSIVKNTTSSNTVDCNFVPNAYAIAVYQFWV